jgi:hypothetical protein
VAGQAQANEGRGTRVTKQASVVVGLVSGVVGLFFLFFPQFRPERHQPPPNQSADVTKMELNSRVTQGNYLDYADQKKEGFTKAQLARVGASAFARVTIVGYKGKPLTMEQQIVDAKTGQVVGQKRDFIVTPSADTVSHRWPYWVPLPPGRGSYVMVIKVLDENATSAIACAQTKPFGGVAGLVPMKPPQVCEGA